MAAPVTRAGAAGCGPAARTAATLAAVAARIRRLADLLIVDGDPLAEPELLADRSRIWLVLQLGVPVAGQALERDAG